MYVAELDREVLRTLTQRKVVDYMRKRRAAALERGDYVIEVQEGRNVEIVTPEKPEGMPVPLPAQRTLWGTIEFGLYVGAANGLKQTVAVVGKAGTTILDSICDLEEFAAEPWSTGQVAGRIIFPGLQQTAGRRAIVRDDGAFPLFVEAVRAAEPRLNVLVDRVNAEVDRSTTERLSTTLRQVFRAVLKELDDLDNPMRTFLGTQPGDGGLLAETWPQGTDAEQRAPGELDAPQLEDIAPRPPESVPPPAPTEASAAPGHQ